MAYKIETLPSGTKRIRISYTDEYGKYRNKSVSGKTEKEVIRKAMEIEEELKRGRVTDDITVGEAVREYIELCRPSLSPTTIQQYESMLKNRFESISHLSIDRLSDRTIQLWINDMIERGLTPKTVKNTYALLIPAMSKHTHRTPDVVLPKVSAYIHKYPEDDDVAKIVSAAKGTPIELPIILAAYGGMRMSEILGLKWTDIQEDHIIVQRARVYVDGVEVDKTTKSSAGTRYLPLFDPIRDALGRTERKGEYVINRTSRSIKKRYETLLKNLDLPPYRFHDLRHHAASVGAKLGIPDQYMMQFIGHSTVNMLRRYQHQMTAATSHFATDLNKYYSATNSATTDENN